MSKLINLPIIQIPGTAFFPNTILPIYITHPNLISMVKDIISSNNGGLLGIRMEESLSFSNHSDICGAGVPIILEEVENHHIKVAVHGIKRVKIINSLQDLPYQIAEAISVEDTHDIVSFSDSEITDLKELLLQWLVGHVRDSNEREIFIETLKTVNNYMDYISMFLIKDLEIKQTLLATPSLRERINILKLILKNNLDSVISGERPLLFKEDQLIIDVLKDYADIEKNTKAWQ